MKKLDRRVGKGRQMKALAGLGAAACFALAAAAGPAGADRQSFNNWHVHDGGTGTTDATGLTHRGVAFFPAIFTGGDAGAYEERQAPGGRGEHAGAAKRGVGAPRAVALVDGDEAQRDRRPPHEQRDPERRHDAAAPAPPQRYRSTRYTR